MANIFDFRHVKGRSYRDKSGRFVKHSIVEQARLENIRQETFRTVREDIWNQRIQSARIEAEIFGRDVPDGPIPEYEPAIDERLELFKATPRDERTKEQWKQFREDMEYLYGPDGDDWGDYG